MISDKTAIRDRQFLYATIGAFVLYACLRIMAWSNTVLLEDTDSLGNMRWIGVFLTFDLNKIINIDPDFTPFYLFFSSLLALVAGSVETGARLCSFIFSILLFASIAGIGRLITKPLEIAVGLVLIAFSPALISLSFAVLTEPSYIATVYLGLWMFWMQYNNPTLAKAALLGLVFGLSFLNRLEGIIYLAVIPFLQAAHYLVVKERLYSLKSLAGWASVFVVVYILVIAPQVWRVSNIVGDFALNGREVWSVVLTAQDGKSYWEKFYALDYSPSEVNIQYLKRHPDAWKDMVSAFEPMVYVETLKKNIRNIYRNKLNEVTGPLGILFFLFGLVWLYRSGRVFEALAILTFVGASLIPPLLHNALLRHFLVVTPMIMLVAGIGIVYCCRFIANFISNARVNAQAMSVVLTAVLIGVTVPDLRSAVLSPPIKNREYSLMELEEPVKIVDGIVRNKLHRQAVIAAHTGYLAHYTYSDQVYFPYVGLEPFLNYCMLNQVDFVYIQHERVKKYPFFDDYISSGMPEEFIRVYSGKDAYGGSVDLYWRSSNDS